MLLLGHAIYTPLSLFAALPKSALDQTGQVLSYVRSMRDSEPLAAALSGSGSIGYVSEHPVDPSGGGLGELRFYLAQFALAPVLIEDRAPLPLVLANFEDPAQLEALVSSVGATVVVELAPGRALIRMDAR